MKLGLQLGYWGAQPPAGVGELVAAAEEAGFDAIFSAEAWGSDAFTPLAWWGKGTSRIRLGTSIVQMSGRAPTSIAMHALTLDHLTGGRVVLGMGVSGPQVVEGWYGQPFAKPLARTREVVDIIRQVLAREAPVTNAGPHYPLPYDGPGSVGLGKPLKPITHPLRPDIPIWLGAEGPKNVAQTAEIADGWIPIFYTPKSAAMYQPWLDEGFARPDARRTRADFEIAATCHLQIVDSAEVKQLVIDAIKPSVSLYMGGMGAQEANFHNQVFVRMGYEDLAAEVQRLYLSGQKDQATALIPDELVDDMHIIGTPGEVKERVAQWEETGVTTLMLSCRSPEEVRQVAELLA
ncbi:LLM class F420-dependent oxidoreductase [Nocardioides lianchengensis]|uniref:Probable F420-dependent oxidoreductase, Rv3520c family n=1 Tax=Nocardioides lianchengensis TaxID=1045774 RepID=A0A1G6SE73_9ACTN|nr:LLM class F420-dependent oxidoreductase [Nocardioides lianchengensis]NYG09789.1 F420-dependent oxidoreductase-like protein [Nocardioides lianchengensis]SDD14447.1 probable F420-dependent oxidoreductase, Rv3520c family [Nocardioides lianchengensis]